MINFEFIVKNKQLCLIILINGINVTEHILWDNAPDRIKVNDLAIDLEDVLYLLEWARDIVEPATCDPIISEILTIPDDPNSPIRDIVQLIRESAAYSVVSKMDYNKILTWAQKHAFNLAEYCSPPLLFYKEGDNVRIRSASLHGNPCRHIKYVECNTIVPVQNFKEELFKLKKRLVYLPYFNLEEIAEFDIIK